jgi:iron(III) transport system ATP-binding protein
MNKPLFEVDRLHHRYGNEVAVREISFSVAAGAFVSVVGPSGCGKTTTLKAVAGLINPTSGDIRVEGRSILADPPRKRPCSLVFQNLALFPHMTVAENLAFPLESLGVARDERERRVREMCQLVELSEPLLARTPGQLSGGQQQRVALARAIAPEPKLILLDEPFSNLDAILRDSTRKEVRSIIKKAGMSAVLVTHDQEEALSFADRIGVMNEGQIEQIGTPEEVYYQPKNKFVARFLGRTNIFEGEIRDSDIMETKIGHLKLNRKAKGKITCSIRPEHLTIESPNGTSDGYKKGIIVAREFKGHDITYHVECDGERYIVHTDNRILFEQNDEVVVRPLESAVVLER